LKYSIVTPIFKKGNNSDPANYRPISVLTSFAKVLETALYVRLTEHITLNKMLTDQQYGFRKGYSTDEAMFNLTHVVLNALNDKSMVGSIFFDLEKAFDSVNHSLLIKKLPYEGITGKAKLLIESYLSNRYQRVLLKNSRTNSNAVSEWTKANHGVSQGSVLGPLLFLLMTCQWHFLSSLFRS
jgi:retron-type reverse transcriptase